MSRKSSESNFFSWSFLYKAFHKQTTREIKCLRELPKVLLNLSVRPSQRSCSKVHYETSQRPAPFVEERHAKLQSELWENHAKSVSVEKQSPEVFYKKAGLKNFAIFTGKPLCWNLFLIKLQTFRPATLLKTDANIGVFPWALNFFKSRGLQLY